MEQAKVEGSKEMNDKYYGIRPEEIKELSDLETKLNLGEGWLFRAQLPQDALTTTLERHCNISNYDLEKDAPIIEDNMIRSFTRLYDGNDKQKVADDTLYCLSLMRHYGAPTRLLDFTYSRYVAIYFALEYAYGNVPQKAVNQNQQNQSHIELDFKTERKSNIWCINPAKLIENAKMKDPAIAKNLEARKTDSLRNNETFRPLYMDNCHTFVACENPIQIHTRLHLQHGAFLCPGNIRKSFMDNLLYPYDGKEIEDIKVFTCVFTPKSLTNAFEQYYRMNLTRESLFPGLDGFSESMQYQLWFYRKLEDWRKGNFQT